MSAEAATAKFSPIVPANSVGRWKTIPTRRRRDSGSSSARSSPRNRTVPAGRDLESVAQPQQCGLARSRRSGQHRHPGVGHLGGDRPEDLGVAESDAHLARRPAPDRGSTSPGTAGRVDRCPARQRVGPPTAGRVRHGPPLVIRVVVRHRVVVPSVRPAPRWHHPDGTGCRPDPRLGVRAEAGGDQCDVGPGRRVIGTRTAIRARRSRTVTPGRCVRRPVRVGLRSPVVGDPPAR